MHKKMLLIIIIVLTLGLVDRSDAQETVRIGFTAPITGQFAQNGKDLTFSKRFLPRPVTSAAILPDWAESSLTARVPIA
jgi:hypothetical protein